LLNPSNQLYLRQLQKDLQVSSNTVRLELNKLSEMKIITGLKTEGGKIKKYGANTKHPLYKNLRSIVLKYIGVDDLLEKVFCNLGQLEKVYLTGRIAEGKEAPFIDLVVIGDVDKVFFNKLLKHAEIVMKKKIRVALYLPTEFTESILEDTQFLCVFDYKELDKIE
jgi:hypothetical protein